MSPEVGTLDFVTVKGLLAYGEALAQRPHVDGFEVPTPVIEDPTRSSRVPQATEAIKAFVQRALAGLPDAETYRGLRSALI